MPDKDRLDWMAWDTYRQLEIRRLYTEILESSKQKSDTPKNPEAGNISPEVYTALCLIEME